MLVQKDIALHWPLTVGAHCGHLLIGGASTSVVIIQPPFAVICRMARDSDVVTSVGAWTQMRNNSAEPIGLIVKGQQTICLNGMKNCIRIEVPRPPVQVDQEDLRETDNLV